MPNSLKNQLLHKHATNYRYCRSLHLAAQKAGHIDIKKGLVVTTSVVCFKLSRALFKGPAQQTIQNEELIFKKIDYL